MEEVQPMCFDNFPDQCRRCAEYRETRRGQILFLQSWTAMFQPIYGEKVIKECMRYHRRVVEYPQANLPIM